MISTLQLMARRIYEYAWTPPSTLGEFDIDVTAKEGFEGTVTDTDSTTLTLNDGTVPDVIIGDASVTESNQLIFNVDLSTPAGSPDIVLDLLTTDGTATGTSDYETTNFEYSTDGGTTWILAGGTNGTEVTIPSGSSGIQVRIDSVSDIADEPDETFTLGVNNVVSGNVGDTSDTGTGTIIDDDPTPNISIGDAQLIEGDTGQKVLTFSITLDSPSSQPVTVSYTTNDGTATTGNDDYVTETGTVTFAPGETNATITINTVGDTDIEPDETFTVDLSNPFNANIADGSGTGTIIDDDQTSVFSINNASIVEGDSDTKVLTFTVTRTGNTSGTASVDFATADDTATIGDSDYVSQSNTLNFADGEPSQTISITINGDIPPEADETFFVNLTNPVNGSINNAQGVGTIVNDDLSGTISGNVKADTNNDDIGDQNLSGVTITLTSGGADGIIDDDPNTGVDESADNITTTDTTDSSGNYSFENLTANNYRVEQTNLATYGDVFELDSVIDSGADTDLEDTNDNKITVALGAGETDSGNDFVDEKLGEINGTVLEDTNGDTIGDLQITGVTVTLFLNGTEIDSMPTDGSGAYSFDNLPPGNYTVVQTNLNANYSDVKDSDGANDNTIAITLSTGQISVGNNFVDKQLASIGDKVFTDSDGDGIQDAGETGLNGVDVILTGGGNDGLISTAGDNTTATTTTSGNGDYYFDGLTPGVEYQVQVDQASLPVNTLFTVSDVGSDDTIDSDVDSDGKSQIVTLGAGEFNQDLDAGLILKNVITGTGSSEVIDRTGSTTNDFITAGAGQDTLSGGAGIDCYHFNITSDGVDVITDFDVSVDRLDFSDIFNNELSSLSIPANSNPFDAGYVERIAFGSGAMIVVDEDPDDDGDDILNKDVVLLRDTNVADIDASDFIF